MATNNPNHRCLSIVLKEEDQANLEIIQGFILDDRAIDGIRYGLRAGAEKVIMEKEIRALVRESQIEHIAKEIEKKYDK